VTDSIGTRDMGIDKEKLNQVNVNLPKDIEFYTIKGSNYSQFGDYGFQKGDNIAVFFHRR